LNKLKRNGAYIISIILIFAVSCKKKSTAWNTDWVLPLTSDTLNLSNYQNDSTLDGSGPFYVVDFQRTLVDAYLKDYLELPDTTIHQSFSPAIGIGNIPAGFTFYNAVETHELSIPDVELKKIIISSGSIRLSVYNPISTSAYYTITMPGVTLNGVEFQETFFVDAGTQENPALGEALIMLNGYELDLQGTGVMGSSNISAFNILQTSLSITTDPEGQNSSITTSDLFEFDAKFEDVKIAYAMGYFGELSFSDSTDISLPYIDLIRSGSVNLPDIPLSILVKNGAKIPASAKLTLLESTNNDGEVFDLISSELNTIHFVGPATGSWSSLTPSSYELEINENNSNLTDYIEHLGFKHKIGYDFRMNPFGSQTGSYNEIFPTSKVQIDVSSQFPLEIGVDGLIISDTIPFEVSSLELNNLIQAESIELHLNYCNAFPMQGALKIKLLDENFNLLYSFYSNEFIGSGSSGTFDNAANIFKLCDKSVIVLDENGTNEMPQARFIVFETTLNSDTNIVSMQVPIPSNAFLFFDAFLKVTTKNTIK
jgi:hypothetical protein